MYARTFPVIAQAEVKTILKSSGEKYKKLREAGIDVDSFIDSGQLNNIVTSIIKISVSTARSVFTELFLVIISSKSCDKFESSFRNIFFCYF